MGTDQALTRTARKGKLGIIGARVGCPRSVLMDVDLHGPSQLDTINKDPGEVLKLFNMSFLVLTSNGMHLAPWDAKLGFQ